MRRTRSVARRSLVGGTAVGLVLAGLATAPLLGPPAQAGPPADPETEPVFTRIDVDAAVAGASFSAVGEVFPGEQNIVTSGYGTLTPAGTPSGGGTVQVYRVGDSLWEWTKVPVIVPTDGIVFPNQVTITDMDDDGDNDLLVPSGYFFDVVPTTTPQPRSALTWWENRGLENGVPQPFVRHDILTGQPGSYHGVQHVDVDGDGIRDLVTTAEEARLAPDLNDDTVTLQVLLGQGEATFAAPVAVGGQGGSIPVVADVDGDGDMDIASSQYFGTGSAATNPGAASFLWWEQTGDLADGITPGDFTVHAIATLGETGPGFQLRPVPDFRGDGEVAWVGTNHTGRCTFSTPQADEAAFEFTPGADITLPWQIGTLSNPAVHNDTCPADFKADRNMLFPGDNITSRAVPGQAAPGVFGHGDVDGDGDVDLAVAGDGDHRLFWIEQLGDGSTLLRTLTAPGERFGQSGGAVVADLDGDGTNEMVFSSFDRSAVALWSRNPGERPDPPVVAPPGAMASTITGFAAGKKVIRRKRVVLSALVAPAAGRVVHLERRVCRSGKKKPTCRWKVVATRTTAVDGTIRIKVTAPRGVSKWRLVVLSDATGTGVTSPVRKVVRR